jgi:molybdopterin converting factor small subunit
MVVTVRLHTILRRETPEGVVDRLKLDLPTGATIQSLVERLEIKLRGEALLLVVNGKIVKEDQVLAEGDEVRLIPAVSGG